MYEPTIISRPSVERKDKVTPSKMDKYESLLKSKPKQTKGHRSRQRMARWTNDTKKLRNEILNDEFENLYAWRSIEPPDGKRYGAEGMTMSSSALWQPGRDSFSMWQEKNHNRWRGIERRKTLAARTLKNKLHPRNKLMRFFGPKTRTHNGIASGTRKRRRHQKRRRRRKRRTRRRN